MKTATKPPSRRNETLLQHPVSGDSFGKRCERYGASPVPPGERIAARDEERAEIHRFVDLKAKRKPLHYTIDGVFR
jgi:hypothetical protein